ncbi:MAG: hypothetical protein R2880_21750 [Deinococcales bacterium]
MIYYQFVDHQVHPQFNYDSAEALASYERLTAWFEEHGIMAPNLTQAFLNYDKGLLLFFRRDHHLNHIGVWVASAAIRNSLRGFQAGASTLEVYEGFELKQTRIRSRGSLAKRLAQFCQLRPLPAEGELWLNLEDEGSQEDSLLADEYVPVVLLGSSQSLRLYARLSYLLQLKVLRIAVDGGGEFGSVITFFP